MRFLKNYLSRFRDRPQSLDFDSVTQHMRKQILAAKTEIKPSPYLVVENIFPEAVYKSIEHNLRVIDDLYVEQIHKGDPAVFFGSYGERKEFLIPRDLVKLDEAKNKFWEEMFNTLSQKVLIEALVEKFHDPLAERFGEKIDKVANLDGVQPSMLLMKHDPGYYLGPHTDRHEKVITSVYYFPENEGLDHLGTTIYQPKEVGKTCRGMVHHDPQLFDRLCVAPFRQNTAFFFARTDVLYHGVEKFTHENLQGSLRRGIQFQLWEGQPGAPF